MLYRSIKTHHVTDIYRRDEFDFAHCPGNKISRRTTRRRHPAGKIDMTQDDAAKNCSVRVGVSRKHRHTQGRFTSFRHSQRARAWKQDFSSETTSRLLKNSGCRLFKKIRRRGARKIDELRRTYSTLERGDLSATKHMGLFHQQPARGKSTSSNTRSAFLSPLRKKRFEYPR